MDNKIVRHCEEAEGRRSNLAEKQIASPSGLAMTTLLICLLLFFSSGCVRFVGKAGYTTQGADDEVPKTKQVGFDTQELMPGEPKKGSITMGEPL